MQAKITYGLKMTGAVFTLAVGFVVIAVLAIGVLLVTGLSMIAGSLKT